MYASVAKQSMTDEFEARNAAAQPQRSRAPRWSTFKQSSSQNAASTKKNSRHPPPSRLLLPPSAPPPGLPPPETPILPGHHSRPSDQTQLGRSSLEAEPRQYSSPRKAPEPPRRPARPSSELFLPTPVSKPASAIAQDIVTRFERERSPARQPSRRKATQRNDVSALRDEQRPSESPLGRTKPRVTSHEDRTAVDNVSRHALSQVRKSGAAPAQTSSTIASYGVKVPTSSLDSAPGNQPGLPLLSTQKAGATSGGSWMSRSSTAPPALDNTDSALSLPTDDASTPDSFTRKHGTMSRTKAVRRSLDVHASHSGAKVHAQRSSSGSFIRAVSSDPNDAARMKLNTNAIAKFARPDTQAMRSRSRKGEAVSMLIDSGLSPVQDVLHQDATKPSKLRTSQMYRVNLPPRLSFLGGTLANTPLSSQSTPTEMYRHSPESPRKSLKTRNRQSSTTARSPLGPRSRNPQSSNSGGSRSQDADYFGRQRDQPSPGKQLRVIPENGIGFDENVISPSTVTTPMATEIHLRGGSVVTVTPPELTAWKSAIYIPGPIMLLKPTIVPRKNSVASLEAFEDCIDQIYQHALAVPRRRSDDAVVDDIVDFFDEFEFDVVSFGGDIIKPLGIDMNEQDEADWEEGSQRFSTPPAEPLAPSVRPWVPPVETEETLRAKGIARLSRMSAESAQQRDAVGRRESMVLGQAEGQTQLPIFPAPEESVLDSVYSPSHIDSTRSSSSRDTASFSGKTGTASTSEQGLEWEDDPEEISASPSWVAPAVAPKRPGINKSLFEAAKKSRNPITRIRRLAATASAVL